MARPIRLSYMLEKKEKDKAITSNNCEFGKRGSRGEMRVVSLNYRTGGRGQERKKKSVTKRGR